MLKKFLKDESGATAIEYVLIAAFMALVLITVMPTLTTAISAQFATISTHITNGK
jgi:pilus assembly protein Flp/PilA